MSEQHRQDIAAEALRALAAQEVVPPAGLVDGVMRRVRGLSGTVAATAGPRGRTTVAASVVATVAELAARSVPGVVTATAQVDDGTRLELRIALVAARDVALPALAEAVRAAVAHDLVAVLGRAPDRLDVAVDDLA